MKEILKFKRFMVISYFELQSLISEFLSEDKYIVQSETFLEAARKRNL